MVTADLSGGPFSAAKVVWDLRDTLRVSFQSGEVSYVLSGRANRRAVRGDDVVHADLMALST